MIAGETVEIRVLTPADLPAAIALWREAEGVELSEGDSLEELTGYLQRNPGYSFAAHEHGRMVGAVLGGHDGRRGYLYHLAVDKTAHRRGVGRALVNAALGALRETGLKRTLILVADDNRSGEEFWRRNGWEPLEHADPLGIDL